MEVLVSRGGTKSAIRQIAEGAPASTITSTSHEGRYRPEKTVLSDPRRDLVLQRVSFHWLAGALGDYRLYTLLAPHLVNRGASNTARVTDYKGVPVLFADDGGSAIALGCSFLFAGPFGGICRGSDDWQELARHFELRWRYVRRAAGFLLRNGPVTGQDRREEDGGYSPFTLDGFVPIKNHPPADSSRPASLIVSPDALALVRFGLRTAEDPRVLTAVPATDVLLKVEFAAEPCSRRCT